MGLKKSRRAIRLEPVSNPENGLDILVRIAAQLLPQTPDVHVEGAGADLGAVSPDLPQQGVARNDLTGVANQKGKQLIFLSSQHHASRIERRDRACEIDFQVRILVALGP